MERRATAPGGRLKYTWGDAFLTFVGIISTLFAAARADDVADKGGSVVPFSAAYAAGAAVAICWWFYYFRHPEVVRRSRAKSAPRRAAIISAAPLLGVVGYLIVQFASVEVQAVVLGAFAGFLLAVMFGYIAYVLHQRRRSGA